MRCMSARHVILTGLLFEVVATYHLDILSIWTGRLGPATIVRAVIVVLSAYVMSCQVCSAHIRSFSVLLLLVNFCNTA